MKQLIKRTPLPLAGLALGITALGGLLRSAVPAMYGICLVLAAALLVLVAARVILFTGDVRADMRNPMLASTSGTFWMALMQISVGLHALTPEAAFAIWLIAVAGHCALIVWFSITFVPHFQWKQFMPSWFIVYVGIIMISATSPAFGLIALSQVLFGVGMVLCVVLLGMVAYRLRALPMPEGALPMICILAAPFSLGLTDYLAAYAQPSMAVALTMVVIAQALYVFVLTQVPRLLKLVHRQFFPSVAAMTFPFAISAVALGRFLAFLAASGIAYPVVLDGLAFVEAVIAVALVVWATVRYVMFFAHTPRVEQPTVQ